MNASTRIATDYTVRGGYEFSRTDNTGGGSDSTGVGADTTGHTVFASAARQFGLYTTGGLSSSYSFQTDRDTRIWNVSLFGAYGLPTGLSVSAAVGYAAIAWLLHFLQRYSTAVFIVYRLLLGEAQVAHHP